MAPDGAPIDMDRHRATIVKILRILFSRRRLSTTQAVCQHEPCPTCVDTHGPQIAWFLERQEPVHMFLPGFPCKSPNLERVTGSLPDLGEWLSLHHLQMLCERVAAVYQPGAKLSICADGRVFGDVVGVPDGDISRYAQALETMLEKLGGDTIDRFDLDQVFAGVAPEERRRAFLDEAEITIDDIRACERGDAGIASAIQRFREMAHQDLVLLEPTLDPKTLRERSEVAAYEIVRRSHAWTALLRKKFPRSVRLSIHPQHEHSTKIGVHLIRTMDEWTTAWHGAVLYFGDEPICVASALARATGARLVYRSNRPSHYVLDPSSDWARGGLASRDV
jgi:pyoverdine/dityrosine biosynthesis protein Dit1